MAEERPALSQPSTQPATQPAMPSGGQSLEEAEGDSPQQQCDGYWARLYPALPNAKAHDLVNDKITVGKLKSCNICLKVDEVPSSFWVVISRQQFTIIRTQVEKFNNILSKVQLKDHSMNGTFINGVYVGKGNTKTLLDNSVISVGKAQNEIYYYKEVASEPDVKYPKCLQRKYDVCVRLGTGAFGEVTLVFAKATGKGYAMKTILKASNSDKKRINSELEKLENEVKILRKIKHPNVIQLVDAINFLSNKFLFLELMLGKDLFTRITTSKRLTEQQAKLYFYQIASGVQYLHQNEIIHRDLKPENVLLATNDIETLVKITDFGLSKMLHPDTFLQSLCGTKMYVAPEVLESGGSKVYTGLVDVWSMGVILFVSLSGQTPFTAGRNGKTVDDQIKSGDYVMSRTGWECVSMPAKNIVRKMMTPDPEKRMSIMDIFQHPWLQDPAMKKKVEDLLSSTGKLSHTSESSEAKENVPLTEHQVTEPHHSGTPDSPVPARLNMKSPPSKRRRL